MQNIKLEAGPMAIFGLAHPMAVTLQHNLFFS